MARYRGTDSPLGSSPGLKAFAAQPCLQQACLCSTTLPKQHPRARLSTSPACPCSVCMTLRADAVQTLWTCLCALAQTGTK